MTSTKKYSAMQEQIQSIYSFNNFSISYQDTSLFRPLIKYYMCMSQTNLQVGTKFQILFKLTTDQFNFICQLQTTGSAVTSKNSNTIITINWHCVPHELTEGWKYRIK